jgi:PncC family amidohydrolase
VTGDAYAEGVLNALAVRKLTLAIAEGDTGGLLAAQLTAVAGSSRVVIGGVVAYADSLKRSLLRVSPDVLGEHGAVSAEAAAAMAAGVRELAAADIGVATTGIAGPGGATALKPVGLAYVACASAAGVLVREHRWQGERAANRQASAQAALALLSELLENNDSPRTSVLRFPSEAKKR